VLTGHIHADDLTGTWHSDTQGWHSERSSIKPYIHSALETFCVAAGHQKAFVVREKVRGAGSNTPLDIHIHADDMKEKVAELLQWPLDYVVLLVSDIPGEPVIMRYGGCSAAAIFLVPDGKFLRFHWDAACLYPFLKQSVDFSRAAYVLRFMGTPISRKTLFPDMKQLTERACARWDTLSGKLDIEYPSAKPHSLARKLSPNADVLGHFDEVLRATIGRWYANEPIACELSGGLDSGSVAVAAAKLNERPIHTYGLIVPDTLGDEQALRRTDVILQCGATDTPVSALAFAPFCDGGRAPGDAAVPWSEYYHEAFTALLSRAKADGHEAILRGIGGDEIAQAQDGEDDEALYAPEDEDEVRREVPSFITADALEASRSIRGKLDPAPSGIADRTTYEAAVACSTVYLRSGVWPYYPFACADLVEFCRRLPAEWRLGRVLQRRYLETHKLPRRVSYPENPESFLPVMHHALKQQSQAFVESLFAESRLADLGLVSQDTLIASFRRYCTAGYNGEAEYLFEAASLELTLRGIEEARCLDHAQIARIV